MGENTLNFVKKDFNKREIKYTFLFVSLLCILIGELFITEHFKMKYSNSRILNNEEDQSTYKSLSVSFYVILLLVDGAFILSAGLVLILKIRKRFNSEYVYHRRMIIQYMIFLISSVIVKISLLDQINSFDLTQLPIYGISELLPITVFTVLNSDEDCFDCFNKSADIKQFSIF